MKTWKFLFCTYLLVSAAISIIAMSQVRQRSSCTCGRMDNIEQAKHGNFPWTVAIVGKYDVENEPLCWGSLINSHYILSAAHCTSVFESTDIEVVINLPDRSQQNPRREIATIKNHPGFVIGNFSFDNDISLLKLRHPVILKGDDEEGGENGVSPICLPPGPPPFYQDDASKANFSVWCKDCDFVQNPEERSMVMSKFSGYETGFPYLVKAHTFDKINIFTLKNDTCTSLYRNRIRAQFLCGQIKTRTVISEEGNESMNQNAELKTFCQDDPGSALIHLRKMKRGCDTDFESTKEKVKVRFVQIGISSDQKDCMLHYNKPVLLFTRIKRYVSWIRENTYDAVYCDNSPM